MSHTICQESGRISEHRYVELACATKRRLAADCAGGLITHSFSAWRLDLIEDSFVAYDDPHPYDFLWNCYTDADARRIYFTMCAFHWMEIASAITVGVHLKGEKSWLFEAERITRDTMRAAGWDQKEIINMFHWRRLRVDRW